jgi:hypothetical protein
MSSLSDCSPLDQHPTAANQAFCLPKEKRGCVLGQFSTTVMIIRSLCHHKKSLFFWILVVIGETKAKHFQFSKILPTYSE